MTHTGKCLCGAVKYTVTSPITQTGACHCDMCRRWSGGVFMGTYVADEAITFEGADNIAVFASSDWAERGFCKTCGGNLYCRITAQGPNSGGYQLAFGTLDDPADIPLVSEIFIDEKPAGYAFAGDTEKMTRAEVFAKFAPPPENE